MVAGLGGGDLPHGDVVSQLKKMQSDGSVGFLDLVYAPALLQEVEDFANGVELEHIVVFGIGGSSLGARAVVEALSDPQMSGRKVSFVDNIQPRVMTQVGFDVDPKDTLFSIVTKSGSTAETIAQFLWVTDWLEREGLDPQRHVVITTDPKDGSLREVGQELGVKQFPIPKNVGGRFSVLSAVGLLPMALAGLHPGSLLIGAKRMAERCLREEMSENPALGLATLLVAHAKAGRSMATMFCYDDSLRAFAQWFAQLWGESVGKIDMNGLSVGSTPIVARGVTDQHSQLQLYAQGPDDKTYLFLKTNHSGYDMPIANSKLSRRNPFSYLHGRSFGELFDAEYQGTVGALCEANRPVGTIEIDTLDGEALGELFMLFECATAYAGLLLDVNPFDQPGVERAKRLAFAGLGRDGYSETLILPPLDDYAVRADSFLY